MHIVYGRRGTVLVLEVGESGLWLRIPFFVLVLAVGNSG